MRLLHHCFFYCSLFLLICLSYFLFFFFFSSRRRHTRFDCDWSSDVCSSDLLPVQGSRAGVQAGHSLHRQGQLQLAGPEGRACPLEPGLLQRRDDLVAVGRVRSEEHTSELQSQSNLVCRLLLEKKKKYTHHPQTGHHVVHTIHIQVVSASHPSVHSPRLLVIHPCDSVVIRRDSLQLRGTAQHVV